MTTADVKSQIAEKLNQIPPSRWNIVNDFLSALLTELQLPSPKTDVIDEDDDPLIGLIGGSPELSNNAEDILREEIKPGSGWSWRQ